MNDTNTINQQIAERVMGWKMTNDPDACTPKEWVQIWIHPRDGVLVSTPYQIPKHGVWSHQWRKYQPTTDPADAMAVLKRCAEFVAPNHLTVDRCKDYWEITCNCLAADAETLEMAICKIALEIFP